MCLKRGPFGGTTKLGAADPTHLTPGPCGCFSKQGSTSHVLKRQGSAFVSGEIHLSGSESHCEKLAQKWICRVFLLAPLQTNVRVRAHTHRSCFAWTPSVAGHLSFAAVVQLCKDFSLEPQLKLSQKRSWGEVRLTAGVPIPFALDLFWRESNMPIWMIGGWIVPGGLYCDIIL